MPARDSRRAGESSSSRVEDRLSFAQFRYQRPGLRRHRQNNPFLSQGTPVGTGTVGAIPGSFEGFRLFCSLVSFTSSTSGSASCALPGVTVTLVHVGDEPALYSFKVVNLIAGELFLPALGPVTGIRVHGGNKAVRVRFFLIPVACSIR